VIAETTAGLLGREHELDVLDRALADARDGDGRVVVIEAAAGLGKTRLAEATAEAAERAGVRVLRARGSELESGFAFGCVRQLFEPLLGTTGLDPGGMFDGAATLARPLFEAVAEVPALPRSGDQTFPVLRGLYWLCANLAERHPLLLSLDDAHWADASSLRFLSFLAVRLDELAAVLLLTVRAGEEGERAAQIARLSRDPRAVTLSPAPLNERNTGILAARLLDAEPDPVFVRACHRASVGNPLYVTALLEQAQAAGIAPSAEGAERVARLSPRTVFRAVLLHLASLSEGAPALVRAVSVLGDGIPLPEAAALAHLSPEDAAAAADALARRSILADHERLSFAHPVVRETIYAEIPPLEREALHARAARLVSGLGASAERVAAHLQRTSPRGEADTVETLRQAAASAVARGAPEIAAEHLQRALAEPPPPEQRAGLLHQLGTARFQAGHRGAVDDLREAFRLAAPGQQAARFARSLYHALVPLERNEEAVATLEAAIAGLDGAEREIMLQLEADIATAGRLHPATYPRAANRLRCYAGTIRGHTPAERALLASLAMQHVLSGAPAGEAADLAARALDHGLLAEQTADSATLYDALYALIVAGRLDFAERVCDDAIADARARGSRFGFALASCFRSDLDYRRGRIAEAEADARAAIEAADEAGWRFADYALAFLIDALIELDQVDEASMILESRGHHRLIPYTFMHDLLLWSRARVRLAQGRRQAGLSDLGELARRERHWRVCCPAALPYRSTMAIALSRTGQLERARRLAAKELKLARRFGAPRPIGIALHALGLTEGGERGTELLYESVAALEQSPARLEEARALTDLGAALRRTNHRAEARPLLERGLALAQRCSASALCRRASIELRTLGVRPPTHDQGGPDQLTASERRVCELAANGLSNPEIAQALFVTRKTVETHLGRAYRNLDISVRGELAAILPASVISDPEIRGLDQGAP
jgi:DNA-binding CsgD family transcriptional regulator